ncbi:hypothetical protein [Raineyella fluvialis]|uniref:Uncharacterized protein n=1 Tax=Raineyella fluvialis TaxID=2662261 RepID=A0A5Q2FAX0_9ACTN|nr:hypothetical protein [Raineyella fluvialis]QGF23541.1 hypothetical protein Rai3103_07555 [Raineyella fluvialis]
MEALSVHRSYAHYRGADIATVIPSLLDWDDTGYLRSLDPSALHDRLHLVTAARDGLLVGYLVVDAAGGLMRIVDEHLVVGADPSGELARDLTEFGVDVAASPWGDVEVARTSVAVPHLLRDGWHPLADGARRPGPTITMSGAGAA